MSSESYFRGRRVLITGGLGFIGSNLAHRLVKLGAEVSLLDVLLESNGGTPINIQGIEHRVETIFGDIRDRDLMQRCVSGKDFIFNLAGQVSYKDSLEDPFLDLDISCSGQLNLLQACRLVNPQVKIIFASSRLVYGKPLSLPVPETAATEPLTLYGIHKLTAEKYHLLYWKNFGIRTVILRITNPYGPRQNVKNGKYGIVNWLLQLALSGGTLRLYGEGSQKRDVLFIDDLVDIFLEAALRESANGHVLNAGSGIGIPLKEIAEMAVQAAGRGRIEHVDWPSAEQQMETGDFVADIGTMSKILGITPKTSLPEGLARARDYYLRNQGKIIVGAAMP
ncbi:MAG: NAD-dependent epimerase/dehydratase family protein [Elusimicrobia bacterium]|nr:NAD-dependent epimerase/dehydratase family protein [Elusimicrobiota bacterium]